MSRETSHPRRPDIHIKHVTGVQLHINPVRQSSLRGRVHRSKGGVRGGQPRHQTSSRQDKSLWAECGHKSYVHRFKGGVRGGQPRHQTSSRQVTRSTVTKVVFLVSKAECEAASLAIKLVQDKSLWAECVPQQSCSLFQRWSARRPASLLTQFNLNY